MLYWLVDADCGGQVLTFAHGRGFDAHEADHRARIGAPAKDRAVRLEKEYGQGHTEGEQQALRPPTIADGRLRIDITDPSPRALGYAAATEAMSAETCEQCGSKGDPISEAARGCTGCRCLKCRGAGRVLPRPYRGEDARAAALMRADDDNGRMWGFTNSPGWAGLVRELLLTLESTHEQFRQDPDKLP